MTHFWTGTSGLLLPVPNKQAFPAEYRNASRLTYYASLFNSIEVNSTFYKIPLPTTFAKWSASVPDYFRFSIKLWRGITHTPQLDFTPVDVNRFLYAAQHIGEKKGCLLVQLPPSIRSNRADQLERLLDRIRQADTVHSWKVAVEFRHRSWYSPQTHDLLRRHQAGLVLHDMPDSKNTSTAGDPSFVYIRFHGPAGDYRGGYEERQLESYARQITPWINGAKDVYVYFNNTIGDALVNLQTLRSFVTGQSILQTAF